MKKRKIKRILLVAFCSLGLFATRVESVEAKLVLESYMYDQNTINNNLTNYHGYVYITVPDNAHWASTVTRQISQGWNYIRFQQTRYYTW